MAIEIKISSKGQVVIPKKIRDAMRLRTGGTLEVSLQGNRIVMEKSAHKKTGRTTDEIFAELRKFYTHKGPPATIEQMNAAVDAMFAAKSRDEI